MPKSRGFSFVSHLTCVLLLAAVTVGVYGTSLQNGFVEWDDGYLITENVHIRSMTPLSLRHIFTTYDPELYIPLTFLSYQLDHLLWGLRPVGFHLTNLLLHTLNVILVFFLCGLLFKKSRGGNAVLSPNTYHLTPLLVALLFAIHPLNTEAVAWASARKDLLSGFFFLLTLCAYLKWRERVTLSPSKGRHTLAMFFFDKLRMTHGQYEWYLFSLFTFLLGLLAKVTVVVLPVLLLFIDWWQGRKIDRRAIVEKTPYILLSTVFGIIAILGKTRNVAGTSLLENFLLGTKSIIFYLQKLLWPFHLSVLYPYTDPISFGNLDLLFPFFLTVSLIVLAWLARQTFPLFTFAVAWYVLLLLPSFVTFRKGDDIDLDLYFASDRYAYLPSIGILFLVISLGSAFCASARSHRDEKWRQNVALGLASTSVIFFGFLSFHQSHVWRNTEALFQNVIRSYPNAHIAHNNLGLFEQGRGHFSNAIDHYRKALAIRPTGRTYYNLGLTYIAQEEREKAMEANRMAIQINPHHARAHLNLGGLLLENRKTTEAIQELQAAISIDPELAPAHFNLGIAYERLGQLSLAEGAYTTALAHDPDDVETLVSLASLLVRKRETENALLLLQHAISLRPHHPRYERLLLEIARLQGKNIL